MSNADGEPDAAPPRTFPTFWQALLLVFLLILWSAAVVAIVPRGLAAFGWPANEIADLAGNPNVRLLIEVCIYAPILLLVFRAADVPPRQLCRWRRFNPALVVPVLAVATGLDILVSELDNAAAIGQEIDAEQAAALARMLRPSIAGALLYGIVQPWGQELLFRGAIFRGLARNLDMRRGILGTMLLAGLAGLAFGASAGFFGGVARSAFFCWLYWRTRSFWPVIIGASWASFFGWSLGGVFAVWIPNYNLLEAGKVGTHPFWFDLLGVGLLFAGGLACTLILGPGPRREPTEDDEP